MTTATSTPPTTQCSGCGAKIPSTVSICPYCVTPQPSAAKSADAANPAAERLKHMREKPEYQLGLEFHPMEGPGYRATMARGRRGLAMTLLGVGVAVLAINGASAAGAGWSLARVLQLAAGSIVGVLGLTFVLRAASVRRATLAKPMLVRPARVADRRSETEIRGGRGLTTYYFELEFEDGAKAEFLYPGRGASDEPLTNGVTGVAYTRGPELLAFKRIRV